MKRKEEIDRFVARADSGNEYVIIQYQEYIDARSQDNPNAEVPGLTSMRTSNGFHVNYIDDETFQIVERNEVAKRVME